MTSDPLRDRLAILLDDWRTAAAYHRKCYAESNGQYRRALDYAEMIAALVQELEREIRKADVTQEEQGA